MKIFYPFVLLMLVASAALAREETVLARVTGYWAHGSGGSGGIAASNGTRLRVGHCAVDPKRIPYGSKVVFPDVVCTAVDTGPAVVNRKSSRACGRTAAQKNALVIDRFFESKRDAVEWSNAHPQFMTLKILSPGSEAPKSLPVPGKLFATTAPALPSVGTDSDTSPTGDEPWLLKSFFGWRCL
jgi:3D (Asp-Asp-Asp) domain-containing protein